MKGIIKKVFFLSLAICILIINFNAAYAKEFDTNYTRQNRIPVISKSNEYLAEYPDGSKIIAAYRTTENGIIELTKDEFAVYLQQINRSVAIKSSTNSEIASISTGPTISPLVSPVLFTRYEESYHISEYMRYDLQTRISNYVYNETPNIADLEVSGSYTQGYTSNIALSYEDKNAISTSIGWSFNSSYTFSQKVMQRLSPYSKGWMEFTPIMYNSWGYLRYGYYIDISPYWFLVSSTYADVYFPKRLPTGLLDGIFYLMEAPLP